MRVDGRGLQPSEQLLPIEVAAAMARRHVLWDPEIVVSQEFLGGDTTARKLAFLRAYAVCGAVGTSCDLAGIPRSRYNSWRGIGLRDDQVREDQKEFRELLQEAQDRLAEMLEREATRRAMKKSDPLMVLLLRAKKPELYGHKKQVDVSHRLDLESIVDRSMRVIDVPTEDVKVMPLPKKEVS